MTNIQRYYEQLIGLINKFMDQQNEVNEVVETPIETPTTPEVTPEVTPEEPSILDKAEEVLTECVEVCEKCLGTGRHLPEQTCPTCEGTGKNNG